jgi:hypothetical protein
MERPMVTSERLARAAWEALNTALRLCSARRLRCSGRAGERPTSGTATSVNPVSSSPERPRIGRAQPCPYNFNKIACSEDQCHSPTGRGFTWSPR